VSFFVKILLCSFASNPKFVTTMNKAYTEVLSGEIKGWILIKINSFISGYIVTDSFFISRT